MKFTCEKCSAQYMISDEKVGPGGVKVRCKKCGNVILLRKNVAEAPPAAAPADGPGGASSPQGEKGLDAELGEAFDHAFGDTPPSTPAPGGDQAETQLMGSEDAAKVFAPSADASPAATEWYVAIGQAQVGPLPLAEVKKKWEAGDVGPDSLVWRPGMADWSPLTTVADLADYLAPVPRAAARLDRASEPPQEEKPRAATAPGPAPAAPEPEVTWKPVGASALAALANEEIATRDGPERAQPVRPASGGGRSLMDALPDGGGVDPTGALPLSIKGLDTTGEKKLERRTSVARGAEEVRHRRSTTRGVAIGVLVTVVLLGGAAAGGMVLYGKFAPGRLFGAAPPPPEAATPVATPTPPRPAPPPEGSPAPAPQPTAAAPAAPAQPGAAAAAPPPASAEKSPPEKVEQPEPAAHARAERRERRESAPPRREPPRQETRVAATPPPAKKADSLLDFEANDKALDAALGGTSPSGRSVYVPPAPASAGGLPDQLSAGDINGAVAQRIDSLRRCVSEQKAREPEASGTIKMRWLIEGDGGVRDVKCLTPEYAQRPFAQCITGVVKTIRFPRSRTKGQEVTFPFNF